MRIVAEHHVAPHDHGARATLSLDVSGRGTWLFGWLVARAGRKALPQEAAALKRHSEAGLTAC